MLDTKRAESRRNRAFVVHALAGPQGFSAECTANTTDLEVEHSVIITTTNNKRAFCLQFSTSKAIANLRVVYCVVFMKNIFKFLAVVTVSIWALLGTSSPVRADSITNFVFTYGTPSTPINTPWLNSISLPLLHIVGGSIQSVTFHVTAGFYVTNQINNAANSVADTFDQFSTSYRVFLNGQAGGPLATTLGTINLYNQVQDNSGLFTLNAHAVSNWFVTASVSGTKTYSVGNGDNLSAFSNAPSLLFNAISLASQNDTTTLNGETAQLTYQAANMTLTVTYDYTGTAIVVVPEPSSGILLGMGGVACCGWQFRMRRRRKRCDLPLDSLDG